MPRRKTKQIHVGEVAIGGDAPVSVQSMTSGYTHDIVACVAEINKLAHTGADIVRVAVPERKDTVALKEILSQVNVPIVADVHFHFKRALEAIEAGVHKIRLNPGNIGDIQQVNSVIDAGGGRPCFGDFHGVDIEGPCNVGVPLEMGRVWGIDHDAAQRFPIDIQLSIPLHCCKTLSQRRLSLFSDGSCFTGEALQLLLPLILVHLGVDPVRGAVWRRNCELTPRATIA